MSRPGQLIVCLLLAKCCPNPTGPLMLLSVQLPAAGPLRVQEPVHPLQLLPVPLLRLPSCLLPGPVCCLLLTTLWGLCCCFCLLSAPPLSPIPAALAMSASSCTRNWQWGCGVVVTIASRCFCLRSCRAD